MYVVKVTDILQMEGEPEPHHKLLEKGLLHQWQPGACILKVECNIHVCARRCPIYILHSVLEKGNVKMYVFVYHTST